MKTSFGPIAILAMMFFSLLIQPTPALASPENDRVYQFEYLGWLKPHDNVDGIFADYLDEQYAKYFKRQSRWGIKKLNRLNDVLGKSDLSYWELIQKPEVLKKIAQKYQVDSLLRTRVYKEADTYRFVLDFVFAPRGDTLASFEFRYLDPGKDRGLEGSDLPEALFKGLDELLKKLPFMGQVTGVQGEVVTVNMGRNQKVKPRDHLGVYTLQSVKRHPILNTIEEWRWSPVGHIQVDQVEESISFGHVISTEPDQHILAWQKIREVSTPPEEPVKPTTVGSTQADLPRLGWVAANIGVGLYSREVGPSTGTGRGGGGMGLSFEFEGQLWLNSRWLSQVGYSGTTGSYSPTNLSTGAEIGSSYDVTASRFRLALGYALIPAKTIFDSTGWVHFGYRSNSFSLGASSVDLSGPSSINSFFVGVGGEFPINQQFAAQLGLDIGLLRSASQSFPDYGSTAGTSDLMFQFGGTYRFESNIFFRLNFKINSQSMDFVSGDTVSQKMFSICPSVMYYF